MVRLFRRTCRIHASLEAWSRARRRHQRTNNPKTWLKSFEGRPTPKMNRSTCPKIGANQYYQIQYSNNPQTWIWNLGHLVNQWKMAHPIRADMKSPRNHWMYGHNQSPSGPTAEGDMHPRFQLLQKSREAVPKPMRVDHWRLPRKFDRTLYITSRDAWRCGVQIMYPKRHGNPNDINHFNKQMAHARTTALNE